MPRRGRVDLGRRDAGRLPQAVVKDGAAAAPGDAERLVRVSHGVAGEGVTVQMLVGKTWVAVLFLLAIWGAGTGWGWLRLRTGSVWPPLLGHTGAVAAYMIVAKPYLAI